MIMWKKTEKIERMRVREMLVWHQSFRQRNVAWKKATEENSVISNLTGGWYGLLIRPIESLSPQHNISIRLFITPFSPPSTYIHRVTHSLAYNLESRHPPCSTTYSECIILNKCQLDFKQYINTPWKAKHSVRANFDNL